MSRCSCCLISFLLAAVAIGNAAKLPKDVKRCDRKSSEFDNCIIDACLDLLPKLKKPIPEIGLPSFDPLVVTSMTIGAGSGPVAVEQRYTDLNVFGLTEIRDIKAVKFDFDKNTLFLEGALKDFTFTANYELDGKVLLLPIQGKGPCTLTIHGGKMKVMMNYEEIQKNGNTHFKFTKSQLNFDPDKVSFQFDNLFNGDKALGDNMNKVLNDNWKEVFQDIKKGYEDSIGTIIQGLANQVFSKIPVNDIFINS